MLGMNATLYFYVSFWKEHDVNYFANSDEIIRGLEVMKVFPIAAVVACGLAEGG